MPGFERREGIGASEAAAVLGVSPFKKPIDIWREKVEGNADDHFTPRKLWGKLLEDAIRNHYAKTHGVKVRVYRKAVQHKRLPFLFATPDGKIVGQNGLLEVKTSGERNRWLDGVPVFYKVQGVHQMACTGADWVDFAVLIGGSDYREFRLDRDDEEVQMLEDELAEWWQKHVIEKVEPDPDGSLSYRSFLGTLEDTGTEIVATAEIAAALIEYIEVRNQADQMFATADLLRQQIQKYMGENAVLLSPDYRATWRRNRDSEVVEWNLLALDLRNLIEAMADGKHMENPLGFADALQSLHTSTQKGARPFRVREVKKRD